MDEEKKTEEKPTQPEDEGVQPTADNEVSKLNAETERIEKAIAEKANAEARAKLGGVTAAMTPAVKPLEITDEGYADAVERGEANPLKDDGFI